MVRARSLRLGGNVMDDAITRAVKTQHGLLIGRNAARSLKMTLGLADDVLAEAEIVGVDAARRVPRAHVSARLVAGAIEPTVAAIINAVEELLSDIRPTWLRSGTGKIRLSGGGAASPRTCLSDRDSGRHPRGRRRGSASVRDQGRSADPGARPCVSAG